MMLRFEDYELDAQALELRRANARVELAPMAFRVLAYLAERSDRMVGRRELYAQFWPEGGVDCERLLNTYIRQIRVALDEQAGQNRYLRTYPRRGYRFLAEVRTADSVLAGSTANSTSGGIEYPERTFLFARRPPQFAVAAVVLVFAMLAWGHSAEDSGPPRTSTLAYRMGQELLAHPQPTVRATAADRFREAVSLDPTFASAYSGLAVSLFWAGDPQGAEEAARSALKLAPRDGRAHLALGSVLLQAHWDWDGAERHLREAVANAPDDPDPRVALAFLLVSAGRDGEARRTLNAAVRLEPASASVTGDLGLMYGWLGDYASARELCQRTIEIEPAATWGHECALQAARALKDRAEVVRRTRSLVALAGADPDEIFQGVTGSEAHVTALQKFVLAESRALSHFSEALVWAELEELSSAVDALEQAALARESGVVAIAAIPVFRTLAGIPRYEALVRRVRGS